MKIIYVYEGVVPISSSIRNAWIDFSSMDCSIVAVVSDVIRDGEPVVGYGFNSNGRYSAGEILRRRVVPRLLDADPAACSTTGQLDPAQAWDVMMSNEKPGGHGERSVAVGVVDMALFDLAAKIAGNRCTGSSRTATATASPTTRSSSTPRAATTHPANASPTCRTRCAASSTWATTWSR